MSEQTNTIEAWAIVEIMGHNKAAGFVTTESFGGTVMLRIEVPDLPERKREISRYETPDGLYSMSLQKFEEILPAETGHTQYVGMSSIFRLRPCTKETALAAVDKMRQQPAKLLHIGPAVELARLNGPEFDETDKIERLADERREETYIEIPF